MIYVISRCFILDQWLSYVNIGKKGAIGGRRRFSKLFTTNISCFSSQKIKILEQHEEMGDQK